MDLKKPLTFDEQLDKLIAHGMVISDREKAKDILKKVNYYRFTGYALQFRKDPSGSDYIEGTTFETVYHLYKVDEILRDTFRRYIEKAEVYYRTQIAYGFSIAKCTDAPYDQHYDENNFYNKKGYKEVMETFGREQNYYKDSLIVKHHKTKYSSKMPLWVIVELMSFSNMSKLYSSMYYSEKDTIAGMVGVGKDTLENHLHCLSVLRNKCAHAARMYNTDFNPPAKFTTSFLRKHPEIKNNSLFAYTLVLLKRLPDEASKKSLIQTVETVINEYRTILEKTGVPYAYDHFAESEAPGTPFICYLIPGSNNFAADGKVYYKVSKVHIELYTDLKDLAVEGMIEAVLDEYGIFYEKTEVWIESEKLYEVLYTFEMEV